MENAQYKLNNLFEFNELSDIQLTSLAKSKEYKSLKNKMVKNLKGVKKNDGFVINTLKKNL